MLTAMLILPAALCVLLVGGTLMRRGRPEPFGGATTLQLFAHVAMLAGLVLTLLGLAIGLKVALSYLDHSVAYGAYSVPAEQLNANLPSVEEERLHDLARAWLLSGIGVAVVLLHATVSRLAARRPGGAPVWLAEGCLAILAAATGIVGLVAAAASAYYTVGQIRLAGAGRPFADVLAIAVVFAAAWTATLLAIARGTVRSRHQGVPQ